MEDHARIEGTWPRSHAEAIERGEAERAVHALAVLHRAQTRTASKMRDDHAPARDLGRDRRQHGRDVFVRQPMEAVALDAGVADLGRQRHELGDRWPATMKAGVEAGDLRYAGNPFPHRLHCREVIGLMQRCERDERAKVLEDLRRDDGRAGVTRTAVNDTMTHTTDGGAAEVLSQPVGDEADRCPAIPDGAVQRSIGQRLPGPVLRRESRARADARYLAACFELPRCGVGPSEHGELQARRAGIDDDRVLAHGRDSRTGLTLLPEGPFVAHAPPARQLRSSRCESEHCRHGSSG